LRGLVKATPRMTLSRIMQLMVNVEMFESEGDDNN
jgi:hypothetical protein